ncbi:MAG: hypothetical protein M3N19_06020, partial [Candidatus Eremiobacteraeota bacterium]|nr:hypothetical protein [Candidatus Eremiobacteraeota bacterium]
PGANGQPLNPKHARYAWRNPDKVMTAVAGDGITESGIAAIRSAMHGIAIPLRELHTPPGGSSAKVYIMPNPNANR